MARTLSLHDLIEDKARTDPGYAIAYALLKLAHAQESCAVQLKYLGNGDADTPMGAIEAFGHNIGAKLDTLTEVLGDAGADRDGTAAAALYRIGDKLDKLTEAVEATGP